MKVALCIWTLYNTTQHILWNQKDRWSFSDKQKVHYILERKPSLETT